MSSTAIRYRLPGIILTLIGGALLFHTFSPQYADTMIGLQHGPAFFPRLLLFGWLVLSIMSTLIIPEALCDALDIHRRHGKAVLLCLVLLLFLLGLKPLGFILASFLLCLSTQLIVLGRVSMAGGLRACLWAAILSLSSWACFEFAVGIPLPEATLF